MQSFEDLGVAPEIAEALAAEGIEFATPLQETAIPVIRKGNNLLMESGPGAGVLVAWAAGLLERLEPGGTSPSAIVLCATRDTADRLAESTARMTTTLDVRVAALGSSWVMPERAAMLFTTADDAVRAFTDGTLSPADVTALVVDQAQMIEQMSGLDSIERVFEYLPAGTQKIMSALPMSPGVADLASRHFKRTMAVPAAEPDAPSRGEVRFRITAAPREAGALEVIEDVLTEGARHVLVYSRTEDRAADLGDYLTLHGFVSGAPGDPDVPVWLGVDALEGRAAAEGAEGVVVVSCDVPADPDTLDRRHSISSGGVVVVLPREVTHLKRLGKRTGYETVPFPPRPSDSDPMQAMRASLEEAISSEDIAPYMTALEPMLERYDPIEVAAAALALLRKRAPAAPTAAKTAPARTAPGTMPSWAKLFVGVGERDGLKKGDLLGAITGEASVSGDAVGRIEIRESHSLVEVHDTEARKIIQALNGTTIKGRAVRVDFDRPRKGPPPQRSRPPRG